MTARRTVYIAADFARKEEARELADQIVAACPWLRLRASWITSQPTFKDGGLGGELAQEDAANAANSSKDDLDDVMASDIFVQLTTGEAARGGRHVELGFALAEAGHQAWKSVVSVGPREHIFHYHSKVVNLKSTGDLMTWLRGYEAGMDK